jgi:hypothetical protein
MNYMTPPKSANLGEAMTVEEYATIIDEVIDQPPWRLQADIEADYVDGNQLDSKLLQRLREVGIPPAKENIVGPAIATVCGYEAKTRTDWRVTPDGEPQGQDVSDALNYKLNKAERHSKADEAMSAAFRPQCSVGIGWVEVARSNDPFGYNKRCRYVHRNEIYWDMRAKESDLSDAAWLVREKFTKKSRAKSAFPKHKELIDGADSASGMGGYGGYVVEGGMSTGLQPGINVNRAWTTKEQAWYRRETDEVCIVELWYRRWVSVYVLKLRGGRAVEFDADNPAHQAAVMSGQGNLEKSTVARVRRSYWLGPHCLDDSPSPYPHPHFPYVPFWGYREDMTGIPFALVRDMVFPQDNLNSTIAKLRWGLAATRTERTKGAVAMSDDQFRRQVARPDADIVLDAEHFRSNPGARFEVKRDFQLNAQQFQLMADSRASIERVSGITASLQGRQGTARSGLQEQTQLEQSQVSIADLMDNFKAARALVGEMLLAMEIEDIGHEEEVVVIEGDVLNEAREVVLNKPEQDPETGLHYLSNDVLRTRMKVSLEDVPSSSSFRAQQLSTLSESIKGAPPDIQRAAIPFQVDLMDLPRKKQFVEAVRAAQEAADPEKMREQIKQELMHDIKEREIANKERLTDAQIKKLMADAVQVGVAAAFSAMQGGAQVAQMPQIAPIADAIMQSAGYQAPTPGGDDPNYPTAAITQPAIEQVPPELPPGVQQNTSPNFPPVPQQPASGMGGIETATVADNV